MASHTTKLKTLATHGPQVGARASARTDTAPPRLGQNIWSVVLHIRLPPADEYRIHATAYDRLEEILAEYGPIIKPERDRLVLVFGVRVDDLASAQRVAQPLVAKVTETLGLPSSSAVCLRMISTRELGEELSQMPAVAGLGEVAALLGVSKQRVHQLAQRADFPAPVQQLAATAVWRVTDIHHFKANRRHQPAPRPAAQAQ